MVLLGGVLATNNLDIHIFKILLLWSVFPPFAFIWQWGKQGPSIPSRGSQCWNFALSLPSFFLFTVFGLSLLPRSQTSLAGGEAPRPAGSTALPSPLLVSTRDSTWTEIADQSGWLHSGKFPQVESSAAVFNIVVLRKPTMLLSTADAFLTVPLNSWIAQPVYLCFYSWSPSVLVYFCSFIHVHPDEIPHFSSLLSESVDEASR